MLTSHYQKAGRKYSIQIVNRSFEDVVKIKYLGATITDQNFMHKEIKSRLNSENACYHLVQSLLSSHPLSMNANVNTYKTILIFVLYGCETVSLTLREVHRLRVFEKRVLRRIFGLKRDEVTGEWRKLHSQVLHNLHSSPKTIRYITSRRMRWARYMAHMGEEKKCARFWWERPKERDHSEEKGVDGFTWLRIVVADCCECSVKPSGFGTTELV
jgi:hypothetical protein